MLIGPILMERVERMNMVIVCSNQWARFTSCNTHMIDMDKERNCL